MNFENLPQKNEYKFKEITSLTGVKPYVLRFWESEFIQIHPKIDEAGQKIYSSQDLEYIKRIKELLFTEKLSIPKAKALLEEEFQEEISSPEQVVIRHPEVETLSGVEVREALGSIIMAQVPNLEEYKASLKADLEQQKELIMQKQFNDQDVLRLVQTKKKLNSILSKLDSIIAARKWVNPNL